MGARVFEKHFTDDNNRIGPDHKFALNPANWRAMVDLSEEVFETLGDGIKRVEENEKNAFIVQRRSIVCSKDLKKGSIIKKEDLDFLRPARREVFIPMRLILLQVRSYKLIRKKMNQFLKRIYARGNSTCKK